MRGAVAVLPPLKVATVDDAADYAFAIGPADVCWPLLVGAVAFGAASVALATRRLRLGITLAVDALVMLAGCLLLVPLIGAHRHRSGPLATPTQDQVAAQRLHGRRAPAGGRPDRGSDWWSRRGVLGRC